MSKLHDLIQPHIREIKPYSPGKPVQELERELGIDSSIKLASNESPLGPSPAVVEAIQREAGELNRYPEDSCFYLRQVLAQQLGVSPESLVLAAGADGILELLGKVFLGREHSAVFHWPSFAMYPIVTQANAARAIRGDLTPGFATDVQAVLDAVEPDTRLVFIANPNNPTGASVGAADFERLVLELPDHVILVADEAYFEYVRRKDFPDTLALLRQREGLVILRTLSKIYGLAGLRVGYGIASPDLNAYLERARHPFIVNSLAQAAAIAALGDPGHVEQIRSLTHQGLDQLEQGVAALGMRAVPSAANFLLIEVGEDAMKVYSALLRRGVITRPLESFGLTRHLRVTAGLPEENQRFLDALREETAA